MPKTVTPTTSELVAKIGEHIRSNTVERAEMAELGLLALISRQHCIFIGEPGVAKSMVIEMMANTIGPSSAGETFNYARKLLSKESSLDHVFGPVDLIRWANGDGQMVRSIENFMPWAHVGFIDELDKANALVKQALLTLLNERLFENPDMQQAPLMSMFGAGNAWPTDPALEAFYDRFVLRYEAKAIQNPGSFVDFLTMDIDETPDPIITLDDLRTAQAEAAQVGISTTIARTLGEIRSNLADVGVHPSDRRFRQALGPLKAQAWLAGRDEVVSADLRVLNHVLWVDPTQTADVASILSDYIAPADRKALALIGDLGNLLAEIKTMSENYDKSDPQMNADLAEKMRTFKEAHNDHQTLRQEFGNELSPAMTDQLDAHLGQLKSLLKPMVPKTNGGKALD